MTTSTVQSTPPATTQPSVTSPGGRVRAAWHALRAAASEMNYAIECLSDPRVRR